jgi:membrane protease YdiL (CAAX protease family)
MDSLGTDNKGKRSGNITLFGELCAVVAGAFGALAVFSYLPLVLPVLGDYAAALIAAAFIYLPAWALWRQNRRFDEIGVRWSGWGSVGLLVLVMVLVFPLFAGGFFAYHRVLYGRTPCLSSDRLADWPEELTRESGELRGELSLRATSGGSLYLESRGRVPRGVVVEWEPRSSPAWLIRSGDGGRKLLAVEPGELTLGPGDRLRIHPRSGEAAVTVAAAQGLDSVELPGGGRAALPYTARRGFGWLLTMLFVQVILIALPEELFFRGYVQTRLQALIPRRWMVLGGDVGPAVVLTSVVFALSHLVAIPSGHRLAVFFPSLLFGWLRDRTGSVVGPIVLHALSNVLMQVLHHGLC